MMMVMMIIRRRRGINRNTTGHQRNLHRTHIKVSATCYDVLVLPYQLAKKSAMKRCDGLSHAWIKARVTRKSDRCGKVTVPCCGRMTVNRKASADLHVS